MLYVGEWLRRRLDRANLVLQTAQDAIKGAVPLFKYFGKIPSGRPDSGRLGRVEGMEGSDKSGNDRFIVLDKEGFESKQELVNVCELEDALVCNLGCGTETTFGVAGQSRYARQR